ncbi:S8 family serine peptidase [Sphingomonas sp. 2378]|uniref:S8 family serine peptidase n=1 Tax=Sphingomonas sp. 2378 TaxID=1219748 RepID=UPI00311AD4E4
MVGAKAAYAYDKGITGKGVTIAVIDTGIATSSVEFAGRISPDSKAFESRIARCATCAPETVTFPLDDVQGHGTEVASFALAAKNGTGVHGVAYEATLLALKIAAPDLENVTATSVIKEADGANPSNIAPAITYAVEKGAFVISLSLNGEAAGHTATEQRNAMDGVVKADRLLVQSVSNFVDDKSAAPGTITRNLVGEKLENRDSFLFGIRVDSALRPPSGNGLPGDLADRTLAVVATDVSVVGKDGLAADHPDPRACPDARLRALRERAEGRGERTAVSGSSPQHLRQADQGSQARATMIAWRQSFAAQINASDWRGRRDQMNAARRMFGMHFATIERALMAATAPAVAALDAAARFPSYDAWCAGASAPSVPQALGLAVPMVVASSGDHAAAGIPVAGYAWHRDDGACFYRRINQPGPAFTDHGPTLAIHTLRRADVVAALKLAQRKWGTVELIAGSDAFLRMAVEVADEEKIMLTGKLATRIREEIALDAARSTPPAQPVPTATIEAGPASVSAVSLPAATTMSQPPSPAPPTLDEMRGEHPAVDAWLDEWRRDPKAMAKLRPLAAKAFADTKARNLLDQWAAEGLQAAMRLRQHAGDHAKRLAAQAQAPGRGLQLR